MQMHIPLTVIALLLCGVCVIAQDSEEPQFYEVIIDGKSFVVKKNKPTVVVSEEDPSVTYELAVRVEPPQQKKLNTVEFTHDWLFKVHDNHDKKLRRVRLVHEMGFTMIITDLGGPIPPENQIAASTELIKEAVGMCKDMNEVTVKDEHRLNLPNAVLRGAVVHYKSKEVANSLLVQTICGKDFAVTCITHYLDDDFPDIKGLIKNTVESFRPIATPGPPSG